MSPDALRLVTWNVWFGDWRHADRQAALWRTLDGLTPDLVCLQEMTFDHLFGPGVSRWRERGGWISDESIAHYDVIMGARRRPLEHWRVALPTQMGRSLLVARLDVDPPLTLATVHLESTSAMEKARMRQLERIHAALADEPNVVFVGDMNFSPDGPAQALFESWEGWTDAWAQLRPDEPGYSVDAERNAMRGLKDAKGKRARIDRVFVRARDWEVSSIELLGTQALPDDPLTFISDHFGLLAELRPR